MKLSKLFDNCANHVKYETVGNDVNYAFIPDKTTLYIYFQGSHSITDWVRNFLFPTKPYKDMGVPYRVHRGFLYAWREVKDLVIAKIGDMRWKKVVVVGYSHGGALAAFCHECVWFHRPDLRDSLEGYGFEAPRIYAGKAVGKGLAERWANFKVIRTNNDIVTHCPPKLFGYCHVGSLVEVKGDVSLVNNHMPKCVKSHYPQVVLDALVKSEK